MSREMDFENNTDNIEPEEKKQEVVEEQKKEETEDKEESDSESEVEKMSDNDSEVQRIAISESDNTSYIKRTQSEYGDSDTDFNRIDGGGSILSQSSGT